MHLNDSYWELDLDFIQWVVLFIVSDNISHLTWYNFSNYKINFCFIILFLKKKKKKLLRLYLVIKMSRAEPAQPICPRARLVPQTHWSTSQCRARLGHELNFNFIFLSDQRVIFWAHELNRARELLALGHYPWATHCPRPSLNPCSSSSLSWATHETSLDFATSNTT